MPRNKIKLAFSCQKQRAKARGIAFCFSRDEWIAWWEANLGPDWFEKRGRISGKYVMARNEDRGPYHPDNVKCVPVSANHNQTSHHYKLTKNDVRSIFLDTRRYIDISKSFGITSNTVGEIKRKERYSNFTVDLRLPIKVTISTSSGKITYYK